MGLSNLTAIERREDALNTSMLTAGKISFGITMEKTGETKPNKQIRRFSSHAEQEAETMR